MSQNKPAAASKTYLCCRQCGLNWYKNDPAPMLCGEENCSMEFPRICYAKQISDQMICEQCDLKWDVNDPDPSSCKNDVSVTDLLNAATATFKDRNREYGGNYKRMGVLLLSLFPEGGIPAIKTEEDAKRLNLLIDCLGKLQRYAFAFERGGHRDSAHDLIVYAAMLEEATK